MLKLLLSQLDSKRHPFVSHDVKRLQSLYKGSIDDSLNEVSVPMLLEVRQLQLKLASEHLACIESQILLPAKKTIFTSNTTIIHSNTVTYSQNQSIDALNIGNWYTGALAVVCCPLYHIILMSILCSNRNRTEIMEKSLNVGNYTISRPPASSAVISYLFTH